jgi:three-Cys-motif partner protein
MAKKSHFSSGPHADPRPDLPVDRNPDGKGVGPWVPMDKHRLLTEYLHGTREAWKGWPQRVLIDPFCGPGRIAVEGETVTRDGGSVAAWRELKAAGAPFTQVLIGDIEPEKAQACAERLGALGAQVQAFVGPAVETVPRMVAAAPRGALCLAYVDPYCLNLLDLNMLQQLATLRVDLAVHFSTMDLQRNIVLELAKDRKRLEPVAPGWQTAVLADTLGVKQLQRAFFAHWLDQLRALGFAYSKAMPFIRNTRGAAMYRLVFLARHDLPLRIWTDVARDRTGDLFGD